MRAERDGVRSARIWYCREAIRAVPHLLLNATRHLRGADAMRVGGVVMTSYVFVGMLAGIAVAMWFSVFAALNRHAPPLDTMRFYGGSALGALAVFAAGYIAAWLDGKTPLVSALALGVAWACLDVVMILTVAPEAANPVFRPPSWYALYVPIVVMIAATAGGIVRVARSSLTRSPRVDRTT